MASLTTVWDICVCVHACMHACVPALVICINVVSDVGINRIRAALYCILEGGVGPLSLCCSKPVLNEFFLSQPSCSGSECSIGVIVHPAKRS